MAENDDRIKYYYQENDGVSVARNNGLEQATGEYVMFIDGDDYIHNQTVEILYDCIIKSDTDMVCAHPKITSDLNEKFEHIEDYKLSVAKYEDLFVEKYGCIIGKSSWAKLFKYELAIKEKFPIGISNGEDGYYILLLLDDGPKVAIVDLQLYYYYFRENSAVTSDFTFKKFSITYSFDVLCEQLSDSSNRFLKKYCLQYLFQTIFYNRTCSIGSDSEKKVLKESKKIGKKWIKTFLKNEDISLQIKIMFTVFFYSRHIYELARAIKDPTMLDFYKNRRKGNNDCEA
jgi:glycosyltransferase involved in cell wall biosynthesis